MKPVPFRTRAGALAGGLVLAASLLASEPPKATSATVMEPSTTPRPPGVIGSDAANWPAP